MKWLLWKDYRHNRLAVYTTLFLVFVPHLFALYLAWYEPGNRPGFEVSQRAMYFVGSSMYSLVISQLAIALIGGNAIAGERIDRSAEFLTSLPLTRIKILASKLLLALAIAAVIWITNLVIFGIARALVNPAFPGGSILPGAPWTLFYTAIIGLLIFSFAWLFSSFLTSPTFSVGVGLAAPMILWSIFGYICYLFKLPEMPVSKIVFFSTIIIFHIVLSLVCFSTGTWIYLRRVEP